MIAPSRFQAYGAAVFLFLVVVSTATAQYSGGTGEPNDPYQIATAEDLIALGEEPNDHDKQFILTADIDLDPNLPGRKVFDKAIIAPDTNPNDDRSSLQWFRGTPFTGSFDGNGHTISHLVIAGGSYLGLFGTLGWYGSAGEVRDLGVVDANITGSGWYVGGVAGYNVGRVIQCYSTGAVNGDIVVGGLIGQNGGAATHCYSTSAVNGSNMVGGLVGMNCDPSEEPSPVPGTISQCYSIGPVTGVELVGGLVASNSCVGMWRAWGYVIESFWDIQTSDQATSDAGTGKTTAEMQTAKTFIDAGWDFVGQADGPSDVWAMPQGGGHPILWWQLSPWPPLPTFSGGTGEPNDPYLISTSQDLNSIGYNPRLMKCHFRLVADLDLRSLPFYPIGSEHDPYGGIFDGNGHTISHLTTVGAGLFVHLASGAEVRKLGVVDANITSHWYVGGLAGWNDGTVTQCYSTGTIDGGFVVGGLVGDNWGVVAQSYSTSTVSSNGGSLYVGGLLGFSGGAVIQCYSTGAVSGSGYDGGLVASIVFDGAGGGAVTDCFWDTLTSGRTWGVGGIGKTTPQMQTAKTFLDAGWDFVGETVNGPNDVWKIAEGLDYPRLGWEPYDGRVTVVVGQIFTVTLESNPSTGYRWEWVDHEDSIVEQIGEAQFEPRETGDPPLVGAGGWESFDFKAVGQGQMTLKLVYRRPWEEGVEPLKTFSLQVTVP